MVGHAGRVVHVPLTLTSLPFISESALLGLLRPLPMSPLPHPLHNKHGQAHRLALCFRHMTRGNAGRRKRRLQLRLRCRHLPLTPVRGHAQAANMTTPSEHGIVLTPSSNDPYLMSTQGRHRNNVPRIFIPLNIARHRCRLHRLKPRVGSLRKRRTLWHAQQTHSTCVEAHDTCIEWAWAGTELDGTPVTVDMCIECCYRHDHTTTLVLIKSHGLRFDIQQGNYLAWLAYDQTHTTCKLRHDGENWEQTKDGTCLTAVVYADLQVQAYAVYYMVVLSSGRSELISLSVPMVPKPTVLSIYASGCQSVGVAP